MYPPLERAAAQATALFVCAIFSRFERRIANFDLRTSEIELGPPSEEFMKPTVHDIAKIAGVSLATVDRVLNGRPGVRAVTRGKVEEAIASLGFVRDLAAPHLATDR